MGRTKKATTPETAEQHADQFDAAIAAQATPPDLAAFEVEAQTVAPMSREAIVADHAHTEHDHAHEGRQIVEEFAEQTRLPDYQEQRRNTGPRLWTQRFQPPEVTYERFTAKDELGKERVMFFFRLAKGQNKPSDEVLAVMRANKQTADGEYATGLAFKQNPRFGPVWTLPNNELGRATADKIDQELDAVAKKVEQQGVSR